MPKLICDIEFIAPVGIAGDIRARVLPGSTVAKDITVTMMDDGLVSVHEGSTGKSTFIPYHNVKFFRVVDEPKAEAAETAKRRRGRPRATAQR